MERKEEGKQPCNACLYFEAEAEGAREHCWRFARFVDHVITDGTRNCAYWTPRP
jgi:hypothetical protein